MILEKIILNNLGPFRKEHPLDLYTQSEKKPLILIGGLNGAGKTTLLTAVQLALYGKKCQQVTDFKSYDSFLKELINDTAKDKDEEFSVSLNINFDGFPVNGSLSICRSWVKASKGFREKFTVNSLDAIDITEEEREDIEQNWVEIMQRILSPELSDLFFFDGEKIIKLADEKTSTLLFKESISTLLGLDLVEQLEKDIKSVTDDIAIEEDSAESSELQVKRSEREDINKEINKLTKRITQIDRSIDEIQIKTLAIEEEFQLQSDTGFSAHQTKKEESNLAKLQIEETKTRLQDAMTSELPLAILEKRLNIIHEEVTLDVARKEAKITLELFKERQNKITDWLKDQSLKEKAIELKKEMNKWNENMENLSQGQMKLSDDTSILDSLNLLLSNKLPITMQRTREIKDQLRTHENKLHKVTSELQKLPDEEEIRRIKIELTELITENETLSRQREKLTAELKTKNFFLEKNEFSIKALKEAILAHKIDDDDDKRILKHLLNSTDILSNFQANLTKKNVNKLETNISSCFKLLLRKTTLFDTCKIDSENLTLTLFNQDKKAVNTKRFSAGERQILAVSILWAISKSVDHSLPIIIDTPLARLDSEHRSSLIFDYFPAASDQVILLSTDEEITSTHSKELESLTSHQFMVEANEKTGTSGFRVGYF